MRIEWTSKSCDRHIEPRLQIKPLVANISQGGGFIIPYSARVNSKGDIQSHTNFNWIYFKILITWTRFYQLINSEDTTKN